MSALARFDELTAEVDAARAQLQEAQVHRLDRVRALQAAEDAVSEHVAAVSAGERESDAELEQRLHEEAKAAGGSITMRATDYPGKVEIALVDIRAEAAVEGAGRRLEAAEAARRQFASERVGDLAVELASMVCRPAGEKAVYAYRQAQEALAGWNRASARWMEVMREAEATDRFGRFPANPLGGLMGDNSGGPAEGLQAADRHPDRMRLGPVPDGLVNV